LEISNVVPTRSGGEDLDNRIRKHFVQEFKRKHGRNLTQNKHNLHRLRTAF
jgi:heat shock protein 1/8